MIKYIRRLLLSKRKARGQKMATVFDVADWFLSKQSMSHKRLQKLAYFYKAWGAALYNEDMIPGYDFQAWIHGPVNPELYQKYKNYGWSDIPQIPGPLYSFTGKENDLLDSVWITYEGKSANELEALTHTSTPWKNARGNLGEMDQCNNIILFDDMHDFYLKEYHDYQGV